MKINASAGCEPLRNCWQAPEGNMQLGIVVSLELISLLPGAKDWWRIPGDLPYLRHGLELRPFPPPPDLWSPENLIIGVRFWHYGKEYWRGKTQARPGFRPWVNCFLNLQHKFTAFLHYSTEPAHSCATTATLRVLLNYVSSLKPFTVKSKASMTHC